jgi:hypothetical protein
VGHDGAEKRNKWGNDEGAAAEGRVNNREQGDAI